jgi:hypothetical protein
MGSYQWATSAEAVAGALHEVDRAPAKVMEVPSRGAFADAVHEAISRGLLLAAENGAISLSQSGKAAVAAKDPVSYVTCFVEVQAMSVGRAILIDLKDVLDEKFKAGEGVVAFGPDTPDDVILTTIKHAMSFGKPFQVIPASPLAMHYGAEI